MIRSPRVPESRAMSGAAVEQPASHALSCRGGRARSRERLPRFLDRDGRFRGYYPRPRFLAMALATAAVLLTPMFGGGCQQAPAGPGAVSVRPGDPVVARVGGAPITAAEVAAQMAANRGLDRRRALEERIVFEVLARAA